VYALGLRTRQGQIAVNDTGTSRSSPVTVLGGITNWSQVSAGSNHSLGLTADGVVICLGQVIGLGRLGVNDTHKLKGAHRPVTVVKCGITNWSQVSAGGTHSLAIKTD
jgi:alpha-tubulin suppressor-like RCC1 family protein